MTKKLPALTEAKEVELKRLKLLSYLLDERFQIPFTRFRFGYDALLGLVPGLGDLVGFGISMWVVSRAHAMRSSRVLLLRMTMNVLIELMIGAIPVAGDIFDMIWKSNKRNIELLNREITHPEISRRRSIWLFVFIIIICAFALAVAISLFLATIYAIVKWVQT